MWPVCWRQDDLHVHFKSTGAVSSTHKCSWVLLHADVNYFEISLARKSRMIIGIEFEISGLGSSPSCCWVFILSPNMRRNRYLPTGYFWLFFIPATPVPLLNHRLGMISPWSVPHCRYHRYYIQVQSHQWLNLAPLCAPQPNLLPISTYLYLDFHLCSMTKLKEHSREIC